MATVKELDLFISDILSGDQKGLDRFIDQDFCRDLKLHALNRISQIMYNINVEIVHATNINQDTFLSDIINLKHSDTKLSIVDYCIIAGLNNLAENFIKIGGTSTVELKDLKSKLSNYSNTTNVPDIINDILTSINSLESMISHLSSRKLNKRETCTSQFKKFTTVPIICACVLFIGGVACLAAIPFSGGLSGILGGILLTGIAVPLLMESMEICKDSGISFFESKHSHTDARTAQELNLVNLLSQQVAKEIEKISKEYEAAIIHINSCSHSTNRNSYLNGSSPNIHFVFQKRMAQAEDFNEPKMLRKQKIS